MKKYVYFKERYWKRWNRLRYPASGIRNISSIQFIPKEGQPIMQAGLHPKNEIQDIIEKDILKNKIEEDAVAVDNKT